MGVLRKATPDKHSSQVVTLRTADGTLLTWCHYCGEMIRRGAGSDYTHVNTGKSPCVSR